MLAQTKISELRKLSGELKDRLIALRIKEKNRIKKARYKKKVRAQARRVISEGVKVVTSTQKMENGI